MGHYQRASYPRNKKTSTFSTQVILHISQWCKCRGDFNFSECPNLPSLPQDLIQTFSAETIGTVSCLRIFLFTGLNAPPFTGNIRCRHCSSVKERSRLSLVDLFLEKLKVVSPFSIRPLALKISWEESKSGGLYPLTYVSITNARPVLLSTHPSTASVWDCFQTFKEHYWIESITLGTNTFRDEDVWNVFTLRKIHPSRRTCSILEHLCWKEWAWFIEKNFFSQRRVEFFLSGICQVFYPRNTVLDHFYVKWNFLGESTRVTL